MELLNRHISTIHTGSRETEISINREPECWRLIISDKDDLRDPQYARTEILLADDYFERFTACDLRFLLSGHGVPGRIDSEVLFEALPMLKDGEQTISETGYDVFTDENRDKWIRFGITDRIVRGHEIAGRMYRIGKMEQILEKLDDLMSGIVHVSPSDPLIEEYLNYQTEVKKLEEYYTGPEWRKDFELDEQGEFPQYLKRGVLSEDGAFNALTWNGELLERFEGLLQDQ